jgi:Bacteriophage probable baseplate hub protein
MSHAPAASPAASTDRPGTKFFAPQVRLVDADGEPLALGSQPISQDIVSAKVTRVATGVSQVEIVLNNQRHDDDHRPIVPTWRYNGLDGVSFGTRVRVDYRYGNDPWSPMILARITDMAFLFPQAAGAQVTLQGEDLLSMLKTKPAADTMYVNYHEIDIVRMAVADSGSGLALAAPLPAHAFGAVVPDITHQGSQTYLQFIDAFAERMDYEVFVDFARSTGSDVNLHFEPARSATLNEVVDLAWGRDLLDFKPVFKVWDLLTEAVATGSVPGRRATFNETVTMAAAIDGDLHAAPGGATPLSAADARAAAFDDENRPETNTERISVTNLDQERAVMQARAALRRSARQFLTADVTTMGFPSLRPGIHVNLTGLDAPFDGIYYVTQTVHTVSGAGYLTVSSLRRPGMLDPGAYPGG